MNSWLLSIAGSGALLIGLAVVIIASALLYRAWRRSGRNWSFISIGWGALVLVHWPLGLALGFDRGWAVAAILPGFIALLWIGITTPWHHWRKQSKHKPETSTSPIISPPVTAPPPF